MRNLANPSDAYSFLKQAICEVTHALHREDGLGQLEGPMDQIGLTMRFLRAVEQHKWGHARKIAEAYPILAEHVDVHGPALHMDPGLAWIRDHAKELSRASLLDEMRVLQKQQPSLPEAQRSARRQHIMGKLRRIRPGASTSLAAVQAEDGQVHTDPESMTAELQKHWAQTFAGEQVDRGVFSDWLHHTLPHGGTGRDGLPLPPADVWRIRRHDVAKAVRLSGDSAPGPDGIPYKAWRSVGKLAVDVLWDVIHALASDEGSALLAKAYSDLLPAEHSYNLGLLCCLPK